MPYFSLLITTHNCATTIERTLDSCLTQNFSDMEVIVVDDGSTDGTADRVRRLEDPRIHLIAHAKPQGVCPSRNTGIKVARGAWTVVLDGRHELLPGALQTMHARTSNVPEEIGRAAFMYRLSDGSTCPRPAFIDEDWEYADYMRWCVLAGVNAEFCSCIRTAAFQWMRYPEHAMPEVLFHLDFARQFRTRAFPEVVGILHTNVATRQSQFFTDAAKMAAYYDTLLLRHGDAMQKTALPLYLTCLRDHALYHFLAGKRATGHRSAKTCLKHDPWSPHIWGMIICSYFGPEYVHRFRQKYDRAHKDKTQRMPVNALS